MLDEDDVHDAEGEGLAMLEAAGVDPDRGASLDLIAERLLGSRPRYVRMVGTGDLWPFRGEWILRVHRSLPPVRQREVVSHELAEWRAETTGRRFRSLAHREAWCDAVGARLLCPAPAFRRAVRQVGHRVHGLADAFGTTQGMALLRLGEVTGRPVVLLRARGSIARGAPFGWPEEAVLARAIRRPPPSIHPVRADDRWGLMAACGAW